MYAQFTSERDLFTARIADFQEDTLMGLPTYKDMQRWYEKAHQALEQIDYINEVSEGSRYRRAWHQVLMDSSIARIRKEVEHWVSMVQEPQRKMKERWGECEKSWEKINLEMKNIDLPEFGPPEDFLDLHDIVKQHEEKIPCMGSVDFEYFKHDPSSSEEVHGTIY
jgi:hypothetical protein